MNARYPQPTSEAVSRIMRANRGADTGPEVKLRSVLHRRGLRFRKGLRIVVGGVAVRPDAVFPRARVALFVDGCFWHACPVHGTLPQRNAAYWGPKFARNAERDRLVDGALATAGWVSLRVWEHEVITGTNAAAERVELAIRGADRLAARSPVP